MATQLKNIVRFVAVPAGGTVSLPHGLKWSPPGGGDQPQIPDHVTPNKSGFVITADAVNVTVTNDAVVPADVDVLCELWHTFERAFGPASVTQLAPRPFIEDQSSTGECEECLSNDPPFTVTGPTNDAGTASLGSRQDHQHRLEVMVDEEGAPAGARPILNFIGAGVTAVDNPGADRVDITIPGNPSCEDCLSDEDPLTVTGPTNDPGTGTFGSRDDHQHRLEVMVEEESVLAGARPILNFIGAGVTAVDNPGSDRIDISIPGVVGDPCCSLLGFGNLDIGCSTATKYLDPWNAAQVADAVAKNMPMPRPGVISSLYVHYNAAAGNANAVVFTVFVNGVATALTVTVSSAGITTGSDLVHAIAVAQGDLVSVQVTKAASILDGNKLVAATVLYCCND